MSSLDQIIAQLREADHPELPAGHPVADGKIHRYGPRRKYWYILREVVRAGATVGYTGAYGHWSGEDNGKQSFRWEGAPLSAAEVVESRRRQHEADENEARRRAISARNAANRARMQWHEAREEGTSAYLERKQITPEGVRFAADGTLLVPMFRYDDGIQLVGLQKIMPDGAKRFNKGMEKAGAVFMLGDVERGDRVAMLAEGYATARSVRMATAERIPVLVCFDAGGLLYGARYFRQRYPELHLLFCADDDWKLEERLCEFLAEEFGFAGALELGGERRRIEAKNTWYMVRAQWLRDDRGVAYIELTYGNDVLPERRRLFENAGLKRAYEAAAEIGNASVVYPRFANRENRKLTDFNDLHCEESLQAVGVQLEAALLGALADEGNMGMMPPQAPVQAAAEIDPLYEQAVAFVLQIRRASPSRLIKEFGIGRRQAERLLDAMETAGIVSALSDTKTRKVLHSAEKTADAKKDESGHDPDAPENAVYTWQQRLRKTSGGAYKADIDNVISILTHEVSWQGVLGFEAFSHKVMKVKPPPFEDGEAGEWGEGDFGRMQDWFGRTFAMVPTKESIGDAALIVAQRNRYHVVCDYLRGLEHDGKSRIGTWLIDYLGVEDTPYARAVGFKFLLGAVGRVMRPGCKMDNVLILEGEQDAGKSRSLKLLFGEQWTTDAALNLADPNTPIVIAGKWLIEMAELDALSRADTSATKRWITTSTDTFRPPYARQAIDVPRQSVVAGTVNFDAYLKDESGGRRFWPVKVADVIDTARIAADRDQLWAEAYSVYCEWERENAEAGDTLPAPWQVGREEKPLFEVEQEARYEGDIYEPIIAARLNAETAPRVSVTTIALDYLKFEISKVTRAEHTRIGKTMRKLGWQRWRGMVNGVRDTWYLRPGATAVARAAVARPSGDNLPVSDDDASAL
ncbi:VapE domain-containing protein [Paraburkholderia susongensis]|uniref:Predicted P-loop ATPase and inactivated derivatives n=1 Tax=Paraburkholderia susongensis TaxID=1515439 RepID=A0A1X7I5E7_9BURK|nr:VapE domain-containing protein [Paraburkholderia susongensis]SMG09665.1 Predicted P-loop ATPase and inactivated derivatives [Paraburkholderia susongensis]